MKQVYERIKIYRKRLKLTQDNMADILEMSQNNYNRLERGLIQATIERVAQIASIFDISVQELMFGSDGMTESLILEVKTQKETIKNLEKIKELQEREIRILESEKKKLTEVKQALLKIISNRLDLNEYVEFFGQTQLDELNQELKKVANS